MKCQLVQEQIVSATYGELAEEQANELERHMAACPECAGEHEQLLSLKAIAEAHPVLEPDANLVARAQIEIG
jgi:anti-sigma factor RsiW